MKKKQLANLARHIHIFLLILEPTSLHSRGVLVCDSYCPSSNLHERPRVRAAGKAVTHKCRSLDVNT